VRPRRPTRAQVLAAAGRTVPDVIAPGPQPERLGAARVWLLPQPSGLNANHQMPELTAAFRALYDAVSKP